MRSVLFIFMLLASNTIFAAAPSDQGSSGPIVSTNTRPMIRQIIELTIPEGTQVGTEVNGEKFTLSCVKSPKADLPRSVESFARSEDYVYDAKNGFVYRCELKEQQRLIVEKAK